HCDDDNGGRSTTSVTLTVTNLGERIFKVNFTIPAVTAATPWNNVTNTAANTLNGLRDNNNTVTPVSLTIVNGWTGTNPNGHSTGINSGLYPDAVMSNSFYIQDNSSRTIQIGGLNPEKIYDFSFFASRMSVDDVRNTRFTIGSKTAL